jgi:hypothetical protein
MSKKSFPKAIRPNALGERDADPTIPAVSLGNTRARPENSYNPSVRSEPTAATETTRFTEAAKDGRNAGKATSPDATQASVEGRRASAVKIVERFS